MTAKSSADPTPAQLWLIMLEHAPLPMATAEGPTHIVRDVNPAFCRLISKARNQVVGKPFHEILPDKGECLNLLDRVYRKAKSESYTEQGHAGPRPVFWSFIAWPVMAEKHTAGVMIQVIETAPLYEKTLAMNEALILGSLRQHELTAVANLSNIQLKTEVGERKQREQDARMLTNEVSHRIKNNLQLVVALIGREAKRAPATCIQGYETIQSRIEAIAGLYDLISQSSHGRSVPIDDYLREIAKTMSASLLGRTSGINIEVNAEALEIDPDRAVPLGLLVNELVTNAIKHAFPGGTGCIVLRVRQVGDQIELDIADNGVGGIADNGVGGIADNGVGGIADNGVGVKDEDPARTTEKHGNDYVAIFVRQLRGTLAMVTEATGTIVRIQFPLLVIPHGKPNP
jgi:two-component sensor histidine kinase